jgi:hypothetical protein
MGFGKQSAFQDVNIFAYVSVSKQVSYPFIKKRDIMLFMNVFFKYAEQQKAEKIKK